MTPTTDDDDWIDDEEFEDYELDDDDDDDRSAPISPGAADLIEAAYESLGSLAPPPQKSSGSAAAPTPKIEYLYNDEHFCAISKPAGLATISERWRPEAHTVIKLLWADWKKLDPDSVKPHVVHRLDKDTTGILLFARHREAQAALRQAFRERTVQKTYFALVDGTPQPPEGEVQLLIEPDPRFPARMVVRKKKGKSCTTRYAVEEAFRGVSWVRLHPREGRTHQIRISLASIGHPCAIDPLYGSDEPITLARFKRTKGQTGALIKRLTLHAGRLEITHPISKAPMTIEAPVPKDLAATLKQLRRWALP